MGSLTHVCVWSSKGWTHIAPEEVARSHPGESVSARSGLFMCELCGQYAKSYAKISALTEISALEMAQGATSWAPFSAASDSQLYALLGQYEQGLRLHCIAKIGEKTFDEEMKKMQEK